MARTIKNPVTHHESCKHCGANAWQAWTHNRILCGECRKTRTVKYRSAANEAGRLPPETCPKCSLRQNPIRIGKKGRWTFRECGECGSQYRAEMVPQTVEATKKILVVTCAVNDSPVHTPFLRTLETYCAERDAQLVVIPIRYKNPTSDRENAGEYNWPPVLAKYLVDKRIKVCQGLQILADIKTQPTAVNPLSGMDTITGTDCGIFGHTRVALTSVPTRGHELPKLLMTTGAITKAQYSDSKSGAKGEFHHVIGAVVIELDGENFHLRHICSGSDGSFIDLDRKWTKAGSTEAPPALALILGDVHAERADPNVITASRAIQKALRPKKLVLHDVLDFGSASHHNGYWERFQRRVSKKDRVADELKVTTALIDSFYRKGQETVIVSSNHNEHFGRWLADHRNGDDVQNAAIYHRAKATILAHIEKTFQIPHIFGLIAGPMLKYPARFLSDTESLTVAGIELAYHGDKGPNGSRGSAKAFDKIGAKTVIGHSHSPCIVGGCYQTGTSSLLNMGYNVGPSSWMHSHVVIYASGKRSHIHVINKTSWRLEP